MEFDLKVNIEENNQGMNFVNFEIVKNIEYVMVINNG
jgi:hypothetical protein